MTENNPDILGSAAPDAIGLGRYRDWHTGAVGSRLLFGGDEGVVLTGRNGVGKDTRVLVPLLLQAKTLSAVVLDPKAELAAITAPYRRKLGPVVIINPYGVLASEPGYEDLASEGFNPLIGLDPEQPSFAADCGAVSDAVIIAEKSEGNARYFTESSNAMHQAATMWEVLAAQNQRRSPTYANIRRLLCMPSYVDPKTGPHGWPKLAQEMQEQGPPALRNLAGQFLNWGTEKNSIASDAMRQSKAFDDTEIITDMAKGTFDFREVKQKPVTVYIIMPPLEMQRHERYLRLLISNALRAVMRPRAVGEPKVLFVLNEFPTLGKLDMLRQVWGAVRGYGIQMMPIIQGLSQLHDIWGKDTTTTFLGQAGVIATFGASEMETARWLSERCGDRTAVAASFNTGENQSGKGAGSSTGLGWSQVKVPAVTPHDVLGLNDGQMIQFAAGLSGFVSAYAPPYWQIAQCKERARANPYYRQP